MDYQEEKVELSEEAVLEINRLLQEAADKDMEDVIEDLIPVTVAGVTKKFDREGWDEFIDRVLEEGPPEEEEEV